MTPPKRPFWKKALIVINLILIVLVFMECCLRVWFPQDITSFYDYDEVLGWKNRPSTHRVNINPEYQTTSTVGPQGFRGARFVPKSKPAHQQRILVLGDSYTWGEGVDDRKTFSHLLEQLRGPSTLVLNAGVDGYGTDQEYLFLKEVGYQYQPDMVILAICPNDFENNILNVSTNQLSRKPRFVIEEENLRLKDIPGESSVGMMVFGRTMRYLKEHSHLYHLVRKSYGIWRYRHAIQNGKPLPWERWLYRNVQRMRKTGGYQNEGQALLAPYLKDWPEQMQDSWRLTRELIVKTKELSESMGAEFVLVVIPYAVEVYIDDWDFWAKHFQLEEDKYDFNRMENLFESFMQKENIRGIILRNYFEKQEQRLFFDQDFHFNPAGHQATAEAVHLFLEKS